jgi:hypothetical protein
MSRFFIVVTLLFTGCATRIAVEGRYAESISQTDVEEIKRLIAGFEGGHYEFIRITAYARNTVEVVSRQTRGSSTTDRYLDAHRRRQGWYLQKRSDPAPSTERINRTGDYISG